MQNPLISHIEVKNLGPVKKWEANLANLNFFIGPNASGKSYVNMALYAMLIVATKEKVDIDKKLRFVFQEKEIKNLISWKERKAEILLKINGNILNLRINKGKKAYLSKNTTVNLSSDNINFISMPDVLNVYSAINLFVKEHAGSLGVSENIIDFLIRLLNLEYPERAKVWKDILKEMEEKIEAKFSIERDRIIASFNKREKINIERVASGLKTFSLIYLALKQGIIAPGGIVFIEEPEEHLHPKWQIIMAEVLVKMALKGIQLFVSTHSDYLLKKVNNLMQKTPELKEKITAYLFTPDGKPKRLGIDKRGIDLLPLLNTFYKLYEEEQELI